jgi:hypothetical protein
MTFQPIPSEFPYLWGKLDFLFYQCRLFSHKVAFYTSIRYHSPPPPTPCLALASLRGSCRPSYPCVPLGRSAAGPPLSGIWRDPQPQSTRMYLSRNLAPSRPVLYLNDFLGEKRYISPSTSPQSQHLAEGLLEHSVRGGLIDWYLDVL